MSLSLVLHAVALSVHFGIPAPTRKPEPARLDVVLVNSKTSSRPLRPDVLAQANLDGGGNTDLDRRAKTPLPSLESRRGREVDFTVQRIQELEARQRQLLSQLQSKGKLAVSDAKPKELPPRLTGAELASSALAIARMEAQIARNLEEYNKRPRKQFVGIRSSEARFAMYIDDWRRKVERIGNLNYPDDARGRIYGDLRLTVSIKSDGTLASIDLDRSSGYKILDAAAQRIVELAAPYAKFPADIRKDTDVLVITRTWHFAPGDKVFSD